MDPTIPLSSSTPQEQINFILKQAPKAKYVMSVCGGSVQLAAAGLLDGKRATTNKAFYRAIVVSQVFSRKPCMSRILTWL